MSDGTTKNNLRWFAGNLARILCQRPKEEVVSDRAGGSSDGEQRKRAMAEVTRFSFRLAGGLISLGVAWIIFSRFVIPPIIESAYRGEGLPFLNSIISGRAIHPLEHYLAAWQEMSWRVLGMMLVVGLIPLPLVATRPAVQSYFEARYGTTLAMKPEVMNTILAIFGLALVFYLFYLQPVGYVHFVAEDHWAEYGTFVGSAMAFCFLACMLFKDRGVRKPGFVLLAVGTLFVAMEEISWGQRILDVRPPTLFAKYNLQGEITLHNFVHTSQLYVVLGLATFLWAIILPILARKWGALRGWCVKFGMPIVPIHLWPLFFLAIFFLISQATPKSGEIAEFFYGVAIAALSLDHLLTIERGRGGEGASATAATAGMVVTLGILTAFLVQLYSSPEHLRHDLNWLARTRFLDAGMHRQSETVFEYISKHPQFVTMETHFRYGVLLMQTGHHTKAKEVLELSLADQKRFQQEKPDNPEPYRVAGQVLTLLGREDEAKHEFLNAIEKDKVLLDRATDVRAKVGIRWSLAQTLLAMGNFEEASEQVSAARALAADRKTQLGIDAWIRENLQ